LCQFERGIRTETLFASIDQSFGSNTFLRKKLLRLPAGDSPRPVIIPIYGLRHDSSSHIFFRKLLVTIHSYPSTKASHADAKRSREVRIVLHW
jgi:hypothetical protein